MDKFKYKTLFSSAIKPLVSEEKDKYLAMASLIDIGEFIPEIDTKKNIDLLPVAFNAFVANRVNKNGDVVDAEAALSMADSFVNKPINIEHSRDKVIGVILTVGFSEFGTDKPLDKKDLEGSTSPFNVTLGGIVWKVVNSELADMIEDSSDPASENYLQISASWELGFSDFNIVLIKGDEKNIENSQKISDPDKIEDLKENLRAFGGTGLMEDDVHVYRQVVDEILPLGIGLTEKPAADVEGIAVTKPEKEIKIIEKNSSQENEKKEDFISQSQKENVIENSANYTQISVMKIENLKDITDEAMKQLSASSVHEFIHEELQRASEKYSTDQKASELALKEATEKADKVTEEHESLKAEMDKVQAELAKLEEEKEAKDAEERFNQRMAAMDEEYALEDEDRKVIAADIKDIDEEAFKEYTKKISVLMRHKNKAHLEEELKQAKAEEAEAPAEAPVAPVAEAPAEANVVEEAIDNGEEATEEVASTATVEETLTDKYRNAFGLDQFEIKH